MPCTLLRSSCPAAWHADFLRLPYSIWSLPCHSLRSPRVAPVTPPLPAEDRVFRDADVLREYLEAGADVVLERVRLYYERCTRGLWVADTISPGEAHEEAADQLSQSRSKPVFVCVCTLCYHTACSRSTPCVLTCKPCLALTRDGLEAVVGMVAHYIVTTPTSVHHVQGLVHGRIEQCGAVSDEPVGEDTVHTTTGDATPVQRLLSSDFPIRKHWAAIT